MLFNALKRGGFLGRLVSKRMLKYLESQVPDEEIRKKLTPNYELGCKRIGVSDDFLKTFMRDNVSLITDPIISVEKNIIKTTKNEEELDALVLATGYEVDALLHPMKIYGLNHLELTELWKTYPSAYYGICTTGFPNFFLLLGPNSVLGHNSVVFMIECQVNYIIKMVHHMIKNNNDSTNVSKQAQDDFLSQVHIDLEKLVFTTGCHSWYKTKEGKACSLHFWSMSNETALPPQTINKMDDGLSSSKPGSFS